jgi:hypothetical protein
MNFQKLLLGIASLAGLLGSVSATAEDPSILGAQAVPNNNSLIVKVTFSQDITTDNCRPGDCAILDPTRFNTISVVKASLDPSHASIMFLTPAVPLDSKNHYTVIVNHLQVAPDPPPQGQKVVLKPRFENALQHSIMMTAPDKSTNRSLPCLKLPSGLLGKNVDKASGRDDSDFYFDGQTTHARGKDFAGTYDFKADLSTRQGLPGTCGFFADLKGGNDPNGSPDSLKLGVKWEFPVAHWNDSLILNQLRWSHAPSLESTEDFTNKNFIYASDLILVLTTLPPAKSRSKIPQIYFRPRLGIEMGVNLRSAVAAADGKSIARAKLGTGFALLFPINLPVLQNITLETQYDRRWPLRDEVNQDVNNSVFSPVKINTKPRDYVKQTFTLNSTKFIGFSVAYEYGSLPPIFKLVDSKFTIGLNVKAAFK